MYIYIISYIYIYIYLFITYIYITYIYYTYTYIYKIFRTGVNKKIKISGSSHRRCSERKSVHRNFAKLTGKHQCQSLFFNKFLG